MNTPDSREPTLNDFVDQDTPMDQDPGLDADLAPPNPEDDDELSDVDEFSLDNERKYGGSREARLTFLESAFESQISSLGSLRAQLSDLKDDTFSTQSTQAGGRIVKPTLPQAIQRITRLENLVEKLLGVAVVGAENTAECLLYLVSHLKDVRDDGEDEEPSRKRKKGPDKANPLVNKAKHFVHYAYACLLGKTHKGPKGFPEWSVHPGEGMLERLPVPGDGNANGILEINIGLQEDGTPLTDYVRRPDWLNYKAESSRTFRKNVLLQAVTEFTEPNPLGENEAPITDPPETELDAIVEQYWTTCVLKYKAQEGLEGADKKEKKRTVMKGLTSRQDQARKDRIKKYPLGPLPCMTRTDWYKRVFNDDHSAESTLLCPVYLSEDNLPSGPRWRQDGELGERDYWMHVALGRFVATGAAWEMLPVWWASEELRTVCMIQDAFIRNSQTHHKLYWIPPRHMWCNIDGERVLPKVKSQLKGKRPDPKDTTGRMIFEWMVDREYVLEIMGDEGVKFLQSLYPNPPYEEPEGSAEPLEVLQRSTFRDVKHLYSSWMEGLNLKPESDLPDPAEIALKLKEWDT